MDIGGVLGGIVWLASYPKSGNTWVRAFLHNYIVAGASPHSINRLGDFSASEAAAAFFQMHDARPPTAYSTAEVQKMRPLVHLDLTKLHDDLVFVKTHNANLAMHGIPFCTPALTQGAVYLLRDPRDVAISYAAYTGRSVDDIIDFMAQKGAANRATDTQVFELPSSWSGHVESWLENKETHVLRYEDLLCDPATYFGKLIGFLGGAPEPERLRRAIRFSDFKTLADQENTEGYQTHAPGATTNFFRKGKAGGWKTMLTRNQIAKIENDHGKIMRKFKFLT